MSITDQLPRIRELAGKLSGDEIAEELGVSVGNLRTICSREGISLTRSLETRRGRYTVRPCMRCQRDFRSAGNHNRLCVDCRQGSLTVFDIEQRGRP